MNKNNFSHSSSQMSFAASSKTDFLRAKQQIRQLMTSAATKIQHWWRLILAKIRYAQQIDKVKRTQAARVIQFAWLRYTYDFAHRIPGDFQKWLYVKKIRLLHDMRRIVRKALIRRRHAALVLCRALRWRVLRRVRLRQMKVFAAAAKIQRWFKETVAARIMRKLTVGIESLLLDLYRSELVERQVLFSEEHLAFVLCCTLCRECSALTKLGGMENLIEAYRLFLHGGGYDPRIRQGLEQMEASEGVARRDLLEEERVAFDNDVMVEFRFQRFNISQFQIQTKKNLFDLGEEAAKRQRAFGFLPECRPPSAGFSNPHAEFPTILRYARNQKEKENDNKIHDDDDDDNDESSVFLQPKRPSSARPISNQEQEHQFNSRPLSAMTNLSSSSSINKKRKLNHYTTIASLL
jgi:hypothetical protein